MPTPVEDILKLASPWTAPISDAQPGGVKASEDERYLVVTTEIAKLDSPAATIDWRNLWRTIINSGAELLQEKSKDFLIATYVAYAMYRQENLKGLVKGTALLTGLIENFWTTMFPEAKRIKGRANALQWYIEKTVQHLKEHQVTPADRGPLEDLQTIGKRLNSVARDKFGDACPAINPLTDTVKNMLFDAGPSQEELDRQRADEDARQREEQQRAQEEEQRRQQEEERRRQEDEVRRQREQTATPPPPPPPPPRGPAGGPPPITRTAAPPARVEMPTEQVEAPPADVSEVTSWLGGVGGSIVQTANTVRRAADSTPLAYRMMRIGLYMHLIEAPPADGSGKTKVPPPQPGPRKQIETIANNQKWAPLIEETESALAQSRFWLDLHAFTARALKGLGDSYAGARAEVIRELATVLRRLPTLPDLQFADGSPFANDETKQWIASEVLAGGGGGGGAVAMPAVTMSAAPVVVVQQGGGGASEEASVINKAKEMALGGDAGGAIVMLQSQANAAPSLASRFRYRLGIGQVCLAAGQVAIARGVFEGLEREVTTHGLEAWEPSLASASAEGLVQCYRALARGGKPIPPETAMLYDRVCRLDPAAALRIGAS